MPAKSTPLKTSVLSSTVSLVWDKLTRTRPGHTGPGGNPATKRTTKRRSFTKDFKLGAIRRLELERGRKSAAQIARELGIQHNQLYKWHVQLSTQGEAAVFPGHGRRGAGTEAEVARLKQALARLEAENAILKKTVVCGAGESLGSTGL